MSGICGFYSLHKNADGEILDTLISPLKSALCKDAKTIITGQAGLATVSPREFGDSGAHSHLAITYSGRIRWTNSKYQKIANEKGDITAFANAYMDMGVELFQAFQGPVNIAIIDNQKKLAIVAIDRVGVTAVSYAVSENTLVFGSSLDSVIAHPAIKQEIDSQGIFNYLWFHMVPSPGSIYQNVKKLLPGQYLLFQDGKVSTKFYWELQYRDHNDGKLDDLGTECLSVLRESMRDHATKENIGAFLSGGLDSSTTSGLLTEYLGYGADTFSIGFNAEGYDEMDFARITAKHFKTKQHEYYVTPDDVADTIPLIAASYDEPFGNASAVPSYICAKFARQNGKEVMIAGDGGDEIFAGNTRYVKQKLFEQYFRIPATLRKVLIEPAALGIPGTSHIPGVRKLKSYIEQARIPLPDRLETYNFLHRFDLNTVFESDFLASICPEEPIHINRATYDRATSDHFVNKMMFLDLKNTIADNDLRKVNRMAELAGMEVRYPMLDERVLKFAASIPPSLQLNNNQLRYFFKYALKDFLAQETLTKPKHGFGLPFGLWINENSRLNDIVNSCLIDFGKRGIMQPQYLDTLLLHHKTSHASYFGVFIWVITMLELWLQRHSK